MEDEEFSCKQKAFHTYPNINPDTGKRLMYGMGPYLKFVAKYGPPPPKETTTPIPKAIPKPNKLSLKPSVKISSPPRSPPRLPPRSPPLPLKPKINKTLSNKPALDYIYPKTIQNSLKKYNADDVNLITSSKNIRMLKTLSSLSRYEKILNDPNIVELLATKFNVKLSKFTFDELYDKIIFQGVPPEYDSGIYPSTEEYLLNLEGLPPIIKWNDLDKNQWLDKLETVEEIGYLNREYLTIGNEDYTKYSSLSGKIIWNNLFYDYIRENLYTPSMELFLFINEEYDQLDKDTKNQLFQNKYATKTRY